MRLETFPGRYAVAGTPICTVVPPPADPERIEHRARKAIAIGQTRTTQQDASYGLRQLADVALKALSPGINDPTTAQDAIFHSAAVLAEMLHRDPPSAFVIGDRDQRMSLAEQPTNDEMVLLAFDETRRAAANLPAVCIYLLEALELLRESLVAAGLDDRTAALHKQARLVLEGCEAAALLPHDQLTVAAAYDKRFGSR